MLSKHLTHKFLFSMKFRSSICYLRCPSVNQECYSRIFHQSRLPSLTLTPQIVSCVTHLPAIINVAGGVPVPSGQGGAAGAHFSFSSAPTLGSVQAAGAPLAENVLGGRRFGTVIYKGAALQPGFPVPNLFFCTILNTQEECFLKIFFFSPNQRKIKAYLKKGLRFI